MITADVSCRLLEVDYSGIEAVLTGWFLRDPAYIRLARLGIHAAVTAIAVGQPADLSWSDDQLKAYLEQIKHAYPEQYKKAKRTVHAKNYGLTVYGAVEQGLFDTLKESQEFENYYYALAPKLPEWHLEIQQRAKTMGYLGGPTAPGAVPTKWDHPYGYRHWFWDVLSYQATEEWTARKWLHDSRWKQRIVYLNGRPYKIKLGGDSKRVIAFYPQSTAAGRLKEAELDLFHPDSSNFVGDNYFGRTPLLGPIHDSLLFNIPTRCFDRVTHTIFEVMSRPTRHLPCPAEWNIGSYLGIGIAAKVGRDWGHMTDVPIMGTNAPTMGSDAPELPREADTLDDWQALARVV